MWCVGHSSSNRPCLYASRGHRVRSPCYSHAQPYIWNTPRSVPNISATPKIISVVCLTQMAKTADSRTLGHSSRIKVALDRCWGVGVG